VPRWQVALHDGRTVAVANLVVDAATEVDVLAEKVWRAHAKFGAFAYAAPDFTEPAARPAAIREVGGAGHFPAAVRRALARIRIGRLSQNRARPGQGSVGRRAAASPASAQRAAPAVSDCYAFSVANGRGQSFIGASPERLLRVQDGELLTEALAGSIRRGATASEDAAFGSELQRDEKEQREHRLVVDSIVRRLATLGLAVRPPAKAGIRRYANVQHLHTEVRAALRRESGCWTSPPGCIRRRRWAALPGKLRSRKSPDWRNFPAGFTRASSAGSTPGGGELFVGLRSALIDGAGARLYAGAGIVRGSTPEKELAETELKFRAMQEALQA